MIRVAIECCDAGTYYTMSTVDPGVCDGAATAAAAILMMTMTTTTGRVQLEQVNRKAVYLH